MAGTVAVILADEFTVNTDLTPANFTAVAPVKCDPVTVTVVPAAPEPGLNELIFGGDVLAAAAEAGATTPTDIDRPKLSKAPSSVVVLPGSPGNRVAIPLAFLCARREPGDPCPPGSA
jgi:hypothetical protein